MKLIFAIKSMDKNKGGAEKVLADITCGLAEEGKGITVLTFDTEGGTSFYPLHKNIKRINLGIGDSGSKSGIIETIKRIISLRKEVIKEKPDKVIAFMHSMFIPLSFALIGSNIPVIASEHIVPNHYKKRKLEYILLLISSLLVDKITVVSQKIKQTYPSFMHKKMFVIPNPVSQAKNTNTSKEPIILNVGRLNEQKDQQTLIKAFALIANKFPKWKLLIVGEGELRKNLEKLIKDFNLGEQISLLGTIRDLSEKYKKASIFVMPSKYESFGLATVEAMSYGVPAIGFSDCPGTNEVIKDNYNGILIDNFPDRVNSLKKAMETMITSKELREKYKYNAINTSKEFSLEKILPIWNDLLKSSSHVNMKKYQ